MAKTFKITAVDDEQNKIWVEFEDTVTGDKLTCGMYPPDDFLTEAEVEDWIMAHWPWDIFEAKKKPKVQRLAQFKTGLNKVKDKTADIDLRKPKHIKDKE